MNKQEFEKRTIRNGATITMDVYNTIERMYMMTEESKDEFCKRLFDGCVNTTKTVVAKLIRWQQADNRRALATCNRPEHELRHYDLLIKEHFEGMAKFSF